MQRFRPPRTGENPHFWAHFARFAPPPVAIRDFGEGLLEPFRLGSHALPGDDVFKYVSDAAAQMEIWLLGSRGRLLHRIRDIY